MGKASSEAAAAATSSSSDGGEALKSSWLTKRSPPRSRFSLAGNGSKERWFVLTRTALLYYDGSTDTSASRAGGTRRREKGRVLLRDVRLIERVNLRDDTRPLAFQLAFKDHRGKGNGQRKQVLLYVQAKTESEREEWLQLLRNLCRHNPSLAEKHHPGQWAAGRWLCCSNSSREGASGCEPITWTPRQTKLDPVPPPPLPVSVPTDSPPDQDLNADPAPDVLETASGGKKLSAQQVAASQLNNAKVVISVYPFTAIEPGDLTLVKGEEYVVLDDSQEHWWQVQNTLGEVGFIPSNYVKEKDALGLQNYDW